PIVPKRIFCARNPWQFEPDKSPRIPRAKDALRNDRHFCSHGAQALKAMPDCLRYLQIQGRRARLLNVSPARKGWVERTERLSAGGAAQLFWTRSVIRNGWNH